MFLDFFLGILTNVVRFLIKHKSSHRLGYTCSKLTKLQPIKFSELLDTITPERIIWYKNESAINLFVIDVAIVKLGSSTSICSLNEQKLNWVFKKGLRSRIVTSITNKLIAQSSKSNNLCLSYRVHQLRKEIFYF